MSSEMDAVVLFMCVGCVIGFILGYAARYQLGERRPYVRGKSEGWMEASLHINSVSGSPAIVRQFRRIK